MERGNEEVDWVFSNSYDDQYSLTIIHVDNYTPRQQFLKLIISILYLKINIIGMFRANSQISIISPLIASYCL